MKISGTGDGKVIQRGLFYAASLSTISLLCFISLISSFPIQVFLHFVEYDAEDADTYNGRQNLHLQDLNEQKLRFEFLQSA